MGRGGWLLKYYFVCVFHFCLWTLGTVRIRVKVNVCGSTTEDGFFVQPNEHLLGHTTP